MKLTNRLNLPQPIVSAIQNDDYSCGDADISVTGLIRPARLAELERQHKEELVEDASDRIFSLFGQAVHAILERADKSGLAERRLTMTCNGWKVSGQMDRYDNGHLQDYKVTSVWKIIKGDLEEWEQQLNLYAAILQHHGHPVRKVEIVAILRDWSRRDAEKDPSYPQAQVVNIEFPVWPAEEAIAFMKERVEDHKGARLELPECAPKERWQRPTTYAVMKEGGKRAVRVYPIESEAVTHIGFDKKLRVEVRPGEDGRCRNYCPVSKFCKQFQSTQTPTVKTADDVD